MTHYIKPEELVERYRGTISLRTLANWRSSGLGPRYRKIGGRVLYALADVEIWEAKRTLGSAAGGSPEFSQTHCSGVP